MDLENNHEVDMEHVYGMTVEYDFHNHAHLAISITLIPLMILGVILNTIICVFYWEKSRRKSVVGFLLFILSLTISILVTALLPCQLFLEVRRGFNDYSIFETFGFYQQLSLKIYKLLPVTTIGVSFSRQLIFIISIYQYIEVCKPHKSVSYCSYKKICFYCAIGFLVSCLFNSHSSILLLTFSYEDGLINLSSILDNVDVRFFHVYDVLQTLILDIVPTISIFLIWRTQKAFTEIERGTNRIPMSTRQFSTTKMLLTLTKWETVFGTLTDICRLIEFYHLRWFFTSNQDNILVIRDLCDLLYFGFTIVPFLTYAFYSKTFRNFVKSVIKCRRRNPDGKEASKMEQHNGKNNDNQLENNELIDI